MWRVGLCGLLAIAALSLGCKDRQPAYIDAGPPADARMIDAATAPDAAPPAPGRELTTGGGRMTSPSYVLDVQVGHPTPQRPAQSPTSTVEGNSPVKP